MLKALRCIALLGIFSGILSAVTVFRVDPVSVMTTAGVAPPGGYPALYAVAGATINVCQDAACATPQLTYTDITGSTACPIGAPVVLAGTSTCTSTTGPQGQFGFWLPLNAVGTAFYYKVILTNGQSFGPFPVTSSASGVGSVGATSPLSNTGSASNPVIALTSAVPRSLGGLNSTSPGTGILRDSATPAASELSGDCSTSGSNVVTCPGNTKATGLNGATVPLSQNPVSTNGAGQLVAPTVQGNGAKVQLATGAPLAGDVIMYDASGNAIDSGVVAGNINLPLPTGQLQYLRSKPNVGNNTTPQYAVLPVVNVVDYQFPTQSPGGSLSSGIGNTVTLTPCPAGLNANDNAHFLLILGGVGPTEAVLITGGTCTALASTGTVIFTPVNNHSGAWTIQSATAGIQEAVQALKTGSGGTVTIPPGTYSVRAAIQLPSNEMIIGSGEASAVIQIANNALLSGANSPFQMFNHTGQYCVICLNDGSFQRVQDLTIDANGANQTWFYYGDINGVAVSHAVIERVTIKNHVISGGTGVVIIFGSGAGSFDDVIHNASSIGIASCLVPNGGGAFYVAGSGQRILSSYATNYCDSPFVMANCDHCVTADSVADVGSGQMATGTFECEGCVDTQMHNNVCMATGANPNRYCVRLTNVTSGPSPQSTGNIIDGIVSTHSSAVLVVGGTLLGATTNVVDTKISHIHADGTVLGCVGIGPNVQKLSLTDSDFEACGTSPGNDAIDVTSTGVLAAGGVVQELTISNIKIDHANGIGINFAQTSTGPVVSGLKITNSYIGDSYASPIQTKGIVMANGGGSVNDIYITGNTILGNTVAPFQLSTPFGNNLLLGPNFTSSGLPDYGINYAVGGAVSSGATITPTGPVFHITGTTTIQTINAVTFSPTNTICAIPDGLWATNNAGNIAIASTAVVSKMLCWVYDAGTVKWYPSY